MVNLRIGNSIVRIEAFDTDTRESTTRQFLEAVERYARIATVYYLDDQHHFNDQAEAALRLSVDVADYLDLDII